MSENTGTRGRAFPTAARQAQKWFTGLHRAFYAASGGRLGGSMGGNQVVVLVTTGRRSGATRRTPLFAFRDDADCLVVASNGGTARHPDWYLNLTSARRRWWPTVVEHYKGYAGYQRVTDCDIPMVRLSPR